ncbi:hypothetical protein ACHAWO_005645 [Cyclotella atomus]|uniref:Uncharacterized protein n=1 Tax=Cyclotella atomus TaxID=382360 RepID=A0ABD3NWT4_9STRA
MQPSTSMIQTMHSSSLSSMKMKPRCNACDTMLSSSMPMKETETFTSFTFLMVCWKIQLRKKSPSVENKLQILPLAPSTMTQLFTPNVTKEELTSFKDANGDIRYKRVFEWMLPRFGENDESSYFKFIAARMRNYMIHIMRTQDSSQSSMTRRLD